MSTRTPGEASRKFIIGTRTLSAGEHARLLAMFDKMPVGLFERAGRKIPKGVWLHPRLSISEAADW